MNERRDTYLSAGAQRAIPQRHKMRLLSAANVKLFTPIESSDWASTSSR
jgi:hypothetical protein